MSLRHAVLASRGIDHGFGLRGEAPPSGLRRARQVHGSAVATAEACATTPPPEADAIVSTLPDVWVGVVTADCLPILVASDDGAVVAAVHAGWRGLAHGVIAGGLAAVRERCAPAPSPRLVAAIGPHIGPCCYEVDEPVTSALERAGRTLDAAIRPTRPGHVMLDLGALARRVLEDSGLSPGDIGVFDSACTACDPERFDSYRRDGSAAGRLAHFIRTSCDAQQG